MSDALMDECHACAIECGKKNEPCGDHCEGEKLQLCDLLCKIGFRYLSEYNGIYDLEAVDVVDDMDTLFQIFKLLNGETI
jgi:hypothetical protein